MYQLQLSIFERLSKQYVELLKNKIYDEYDDLDKLVYNAIVKNGKGFNDNPKELEVYTKRESGIEINNREGLQVLNFSIDTSRKKGKSKSSKSSKGKTSIKSANIIGADLSKGFKDFKKPSNQSLYSSDDLLASLKQHIDSSRSNTIGKDKTILSLRRNLLMLMLIPLTRKECKFNFTCSGNLIFLEYDWEHYLVESIGGLRMSDQNSKQDLLQYTGFKFEDIITIGNSTQKDLSFYTLMKHKVNFTSVIFTAEIDASLDPVSKSHTDYVELKTHAVLSNPKRSPSKNYIRKLISAWCQMKLIDCKTLVVGFRSNDFKLSAIKKYDINDIVNLVNENPLFLNDSYPLNCSVLFDWYKVIIEWITSQEDGTYSLEFISKSNLFESYLKLSCIDSSTCITHKNIPEWIQSKFS